MKESQVIPSQNIMHCRSKYEKMYIIYIYIYIYISGPDFTPGLLCPPAWRRAVKLMRLLVPAYVLISYRSCAQRTLTATSSTY